LVSAFSCLLQTHPDPALSPSSLHEPLLVSIQCLCWSPTLRKMPLNGVTWSSVWELSRRLSAHLKDLKIEEGKCCFLFTCAAPTAQWLVGLLVGLSNYALSWASPPLRDSSSPHRENVPSLPLLTQKPLRGTPLPQEHIQDLSTWVGLSGDCVSVGEPPPISV
jgi:hypothetical protein